MRDYVIWSWRHSQWWGPNHAGYTDKLSEAGRYTQAEAGAIHTRNGMSGNTAIAITVANNVLADLVGKERIEEELEALRRI